LIIDETKVETFEVSNGTNTKFFIGGYTVSGLDSLSQYS